MKTQNEWKSRAKTTEKKQRDRTNAAIVSIEKDIYKNENKENKRQHTLENFFNPILGKKSHYPGKAKSPNEKRFHDLIQPIMRFKPRLDIERIVDEVNKHNYGRADRSIIDKHLSKLDSNNLIILNNSSETDNLDESMEHYLKYINSQNRIAIMKMIKNKTLDKIVKQFKKEERDQKIINDNFENNNGNSDRKNYSQNQKKNDNNNKHEKNIKTSKVNFIDKSCAKDILKELHTKTYFNATNIIASNSKITSIKESFKNSKNEDFTNKNLKNFLSDKNTKPSQASSSSNNSFSSKPKNIRQPNKNLGNKEFKKQDSTSNSKKENLIFSANKKKDYVNSLLENTSKLKTKTNNHNYLDNNKKRFNKTEINFFCANKINLATYQSKHNLVENVISRFKNTFNIEKDNTNQNDFDENPLLYNPNFNNLRKKQIQAEEFEEEKLEYLKKLALTQNKKLNTKRINNLTRYNLDKNANVKKPGKEKEGILDDSDQDLLEINNELKNSFINQNNKNISSNIGNGNANCNESYNNEKSSMTKGNLRKNQIQNDNFFGNSNNLKGTYSPNGENVIKINELAKTVVGKCNFVMKKHKNNNTKLTIGNGKLMITSGLSVNDFIKKFNLK